MPPSNEPYTNFSCWKKKSTLLPLLFLDKLFQLTVARSLSTINFNVNQGFYKKKPGGLLKLYIPVILDGFFVKLEF